MLRRSELDLSDNLIAEWGGFVGQLAQALPHLRTLNLSHNALSQPLPEVPSPP